MSKNGKTDLVSLSALRVLIDKVGELQLRTVEAKTRYDHAREKLEQQLHDAVGIDVWVSGNQSMAALLREKETVTDVLEFLDTVKDAKLRQQLLSIRIGLAKRLLSPLARRKLLVERYREKPVLKVSKIKSHVKQEHA